MTGGWVLATLLGPPVAAGIAAAVFRGQAPPPAVIGLNALMPGSGLAAAGRPTLEILAGIAFAQMTMLSAGGLDNFGFMVPSMIIGGAWGLIHTPLSPLKQAPPKSSRSAPSLTTTRNPAKPVTEPYRQLPQTGATPAAPVPPPPPSIPAPTPAASAPVRSEEAVEEDLGYAVTVRCTECGADAPVKVLEHMAACSYCGTRHLVVGHDDVLQLTIPEKVREEADVRDAVLDHFRYLHYLKLYKRHVAPLEASATQVSVSGQMVSRPEMDAAAAAAEAKVSARADAYRAHLSTQLEVVDSRHFVAPYRHGMGTLYQAAFGRDKRDQHKQLRFAMGTVEAATPSSTSVELPAMGKLSYLRALEPAARHGEVANALPLDRGPEALTAAFGDLDRKQLVRDISVIRLGSTFTSEVSAVVWRPWWIAEVRAPGITQTLLIDSAAGSVAGTAPVFDRAILEPLPEEARQPGSGLRFLPMQCPTCAFEFRFDPVAVIHFCTNCHRVFDIDGTSKRELEYSHTDRADDTAFDLLPFWRYDLAIRTESGQLLTDLDHLRDGIDGTLDQLGDDAVPGQSRIYVPAIRCINSHLTARALNRIFDWVARNPQPTRDGRFGLETKPQPWVVATPEDEARAFTPLLLVNAFVQRDIARVNVHQVNAWLFRARQEKPGRLTYLAVDRTMTEPFRRYVGRAQAPAVEGVRKTGRT